MDDKDRKEIIEFKEIVERGEKKRNFRNILWELIYDYIKKLIDINKMRSNPSQKGQINEEIIIDLLKKFLPSKYTISQRFNIISKDGELSAELDIIIWDSVNYSNPFAEFKILQLESVALVIDVKKNLNATELERGFKQIVTFRNDMQDKSLSSDLSRLHSSPLYFIFGIDIEWKDLHAMKDAIVSKIEKNKVRSINRFDCLHIMSKGVTLEWLLPFELREKYEININPPELKKFEIIDFMPVGSSRVFIKFFPSKLDNTYLFEDKYKMPFVLKKFTSRDEDDESNDYKESDLSLDDVPIDNQIGGLVNFISIVCRALEEQAILPAYYSIKRSYSVPGPSTINIFSDTI